MADIVVTQERKTPVDGVSGVVFRHPKYGPVEVVEVFNERKADGTYTVRYWLSPAPPEKVSFLQDCEVDMETLIQSFATRDELSA